eukprot:6474874-Amphidinium_carterae.3
MSSKTGPVTSHRAVPDTSHDIFYFFEAHSGKALSSQTYLHQHASTRRGPRQPKAASTQREPKPKEQT